MVIIYPPISHLVELRLTWLSLCLGIRRRSDNGLGRNLSNSFFKFSFRLEWPHLKKTKLPLSLSGDVEITILPLVGLYLNTIILKDGKTPLTLNWVIIIAFYLSILPVLRLTFFQKIIKTIIKSNEDSLIALFTFLTFPSLGWLFSAHKLTFLKKSQKW